MSQSQYDEVGSRTRQAWLRTSLGVIVVSLLAERALMSAGQSGLVMAAALIPGVLGIAIIFIRMRILRAHESDAMRRRMGVVFASALLILAAITVYAVALPNP